VEILHGIKENYNKSVNMPWVNVDGFMPYIKWLSEIIASQDIHITGEISQIKNAYVSNVFLVPTNKGNLYLKTPGRVYIRELLFTKELISWNITKLPFWYNYNLELNTILMYDMKGNDLPQYSDKDILKEILIKYSQIQKDSINYIRKIKNVSKDYRIETIINELGMFSCKVHSLLHGTEYEITSAELEKFEKNINRLINRCENSKYYPTWRFKTLQYSSSRR
jgi:hypothetical protein